MSIRICKACQREKSMEACFYLDNSLSPPYRLRCKECDKERDRRRRERNAERNRAVPSNIVDKWCGGCKTILSVNHFYKNPRTSDGFSVQCKQCYANQQRKRNRILLSLPKIEIDGKICSVCNQHKPSEDYNLRKISKDGLCSVCRECVKAYFRKRKPKTRQEMKRKREEDPIFRLCTNLRSRVKYAIQRQSKSAHSMELLGCTGEQCMAYLETLFWPGMTRSNMGRNGWVVDHIIPVASFDKTDPNWQFKCFHYKNLQPLWWADNEKKRARLDWTPAESKYELPERLKVKVQ